MRKILDGLYLGAGYAAGLCLILIFLLMMIMSVGRQFGLNVPSGDDYVSWLMAAMGFLGLAHTFRSGEIIRMGLLIENFSGPVRRLLEIVALVIGTALVAYFAWQMCHLAWESWRFNDISNGVVAVPMWIPQLSAAIGTVVLLVAFLDEFVHVITGGWPSYAKEPPRTKEEILERAASGNL